MERTRTGSGYWRGGGGGGAGVGAATHLAAAGTASPLPAISQLPVDSLPRCVEENAMV